MKYGDDHNGMEKDELYSAIRDFLKTHDVLELLRIIADVLEFGTYR